MIKLASISVNELLDALTSPIVLSFVGGLISSSLVWYSLGWIILAKEKIDGGGGVNISSGDNNRSGQATTDTTSSSRSPTQSPVNGSRKRGSLMENLLKYSYSIDDIKHRIGELPSLQRRSPWPWDRLKRRTSRESPNDSAEKANEGRADTPSEERHTSKTSGDHPPSPPPMTHKSDYCIGSIFGLDVGGTLAKLVYFEQKSNGGVSLRGATLVGGDTAASASTSLRMEGLRERTYRKAASAQAVLMARRGGEGLRRQRSRSVDNEDDAFARPRRHTIQHWPSHLKRTQKAHHSLLHTIQSNQDLEELNLWRQESVPDDLHTYAETVKAKIRLSEMTRVEEETGSYKNKTGVFKEQQQVSNNGEPNKESPTSSSSIRKSRSMLDLSQSSLHRAEALDRFYNFARRLDSYREGLKDDKLSFYSRELGGELHFIHFETRRMQQAMDLIRTNDLHLNIHEMGATGGGAHKFASQWQDDLGIAILKQDELDSLVAGMQFVLSTVVGECYTFRPSQDSTQKKSTEKSSSFDSVTTNGSSADSHLSSSYNLDNADNDGDNGAPLTDEAFEAESTDGFYPDDVFEKLDKKDDQDKGKKQQKNRGSGDEWWWSRKVQRDAITEAGTFPYLLVTIGTGVSVLRVDGPRKYERISGSTIGGGTYWGLIRLLTDVEDFEDVMRLAAKGDPSKVDMLVGDIYGENSDALEKIGLPANLVASSFGKLVAKEDPAAGLKQEDLARALLLMITNNIGQVAYLNAKLAKTRRIYFVGNFLRQNKISQRRIAWAIDYWSKGEMEALFLEHEGYFGALGAFLLSQEIGKDQATDRSDSSCGFRRAYSSFGGSDAAGTSDPTEKRPPHRRNTTYS